MGQFELTLSQKEVQVGIAPMWALLIEADGYETAYTRAYDYDEGDQELQLALRPGGSVEGVVLTPDGAPATGAQIAFALEGDAVYASAPGKLMHHYIVGETDDQGHWKVVKPLNARALVIFHDSGWSASPLAPWPSRIRLSPWARVEGTAMKRAAPLANEQISLRDLALDWSVYLYIGYETETETETETDAEGHFAFEKVPAGEYVASIQSRSWQVNGQPNVKALQTPVTVQAGEAASVRLSSVGTSVSAQLRSGLAPDTFVWSDALAVLTSDAGVSPEPARGDYLSNESHMAARARYVHDPSVLAALRAVKNYVGQVDATGSLRFDEVPPGRYRLEVTLFQDRHARSTPGLDEARLQARLRVPLTVPDSEGTSASLLNLGELTLENL